MSVFTRLTINTLVFIPNNPVFMKLMKGLKASPATLGAVLIRLRINGAGFSEPDAVLRANTVSFTTRVICLTACVAGFMGIMAVSRKCILVLIGDPDVW